MTSQIVKDLYHINMATYNEEYLQEYKGWKLVDYGNNKLTGFLGLVYENNNSIAIVVKGTEIKDFPDSLNDVQLFLKKRPIQMNDSDGLRRKTVNKNFFKKEIILTGYSLGGSEAMMLGSVTGDKTITFSAYGVKENIQNVKYTNNIENYGYYKDPIFNANRDNMIGKTYLTCKKGETVKIENIDPRNMEYHFPDNDYDLDTAVEYTPQKHTTPEGKVFNGNFGAVHGLKTQERKELQNVVSQKMYKIGKDYVSKGIEKGKSYIKDKVLSGIHNVEARVQDIGESVSSKAHRAADKTHDLAAQVLSPAKRFEARLRQEWEEHSLKKKESKEKFQNATLAGYVNNFSDTDRVFTQEEIEGFTPKQKKEHKYAIQYQEKTIGIPTKAMADNMVSSGGMVFVQDYVRSDGVRVHSYYRARPSR